MKLFCPSCDAAIDGDAAIGVREMHCPQCGTRFTVPDRAEAAARWGEVTTSKLAIISMLAGVGSLILPLCLCPFVLFGMTAAVAPGAAGPVMVTTAQMTPARPTPPGKPPQPTPPGKTDTGDDPQPSDGGAEGGGDDGDDGDDDANDANDEQGTTEADEG